MEIRVSSGTTSYLGLNDSKCMEYPSTAYLLLPGAPCRGGCIYCPQSSTHGRWLSRVSWPSFDIDDMIDPIKESDLKRICIQSPDVEGYDDRTLEVVSALETTGKPISVSAPPLSKEVLQKLQDGPVDYVGIGIDAVTNELRAKTKRNYSPIVFWEYLGDAIEVYGLNHVTAHMIVGMGENLEQLAHAVYRASKSGARVSLFSYVSKGNEPDLSYYRKAQLLTHLIEEGRNPNDAISFMANGKKYIEEHFENGEPFRTRGCPGCNRPYYTTRPGKEHRNYPRQPTWEEMQKIMKDLG